MTPQIGDVFQFFKEQCTELPQFSFFHGSLTEPLDQHRRSNQPTGNRGAICCSYNYVVTDRFS